MILGNKTLMCPSTVHTVPIRISTRLSWNSYGPTIAIKLRCPHCGWQANKEISLLRMMGKVALCPTNDASKTGSKAS